MLYKTKDLYSITKVQTTSSDLLHVVFNLASDLMHIVLVYFSVVNKQEDKERNRKMKKEVEQIIVQAKEEQEAVMILGDFNGHIDGLGNQREDDSGRMVLEWVNEHSLILLNMDERCKGLLTWQRKEQASVIDFVMVNDRGYRWFEEMVIDQEREKFDLSDHNMITVHLKVPMAKAPNFNRGKEEVVEYYRIEEEALQEFAEEVCKRFKEQETTTLKKFNTIMQDVADEKLKARYVRRAIGLKGQMKEPPWVTKEIKKEIKKRKEINRKKRKAKTPEEASSLEVLYQQQKRKVQSLVKDQLSMHEKKITEEIRHSTNRSKALWKNIDKLRKKERRKNEETNLYNSEGEKLKSKEEKEELAEYWKTVYQKHENDISQVWNEEIRREYIENLTVKDETTNSRRPLQDHEDMVNTANREIEVMTQPVITEDKVERCIRNLKDKTSAGPDGLKPEMYKAFKSTKQGVELLTICLQKELEEKEKMSEWKQSRTRMIKKTQKPTAKDLRPIALTNVAYKLFMTLLKNEIEDHLKRNDVMLETQAGFTKGGKIEDNLFILNYCVEESYRRKTSLYVTSIDFKKAFDSVKRSEMIKALIEYKIHPNVIDAVAAIYQGDSTIITLNESTSEVMEVTSGIRQGCTGSTVFFKIITYIITKEIQKTTLGFRNDKFYVPLLFFADDGLLLATSYRETQILINVLTEVSKKCGLDINKDKSAVIVFNCKEQPKEVEGIATTDNLTYLGVKIKNQRNMFKEQKKQMIEKAQRMANMTYGVIARSCNKLLVGKTFWKSLALPSFLYGANIFAITEEELKKLEVIENGVFRQILGAPKYTATCAVRGEIGASTMKARVIKGHLQYARSTLQGDNELLKEVMETQLEERSTKWAKMITTQLERVKLTVNNLRSIKKEELNRKVTSWDDEIWKEEMEKRTSLKVYKRWKVKIKEDNIYDNTPASTVLFQARTNTLPLNSRKKFTNEDIKCSLCNAEEETLEHFLLKCPILREVRNESIELQQPYMEDEEEVVMNYLFENGQNTMEEKKRNLYNMWKLRKQLQKRAQY